MKLGSCFPCLCLKKKEVPRSSLADPQGSSVPAAARAFTFKELAAATRNFRDDSRVLGPEPGRYRGYLKSVGQVVDIKLESAIHSHVSAQQTNREFRAHVQTLSTLRHPNLANVIGFCADGNHTILVYEYMALGSLQDHLHDPSPGKAPLDWNTRMNIAAGAAKGLEYLHRKGVVYPIRSSEILLGEGHHPKLSQHGLAEVAHLSMYFAPENVMNGVRTAKSNIYSFGMVLLEMITGRRGYDHAQATLEDRLLERWARPMLKDKREFSRMAYPTLQGRYPPMDLQVALGVASWCIHEIPDMRAPIDNIVTALSRLAHNVDPPESSHRGA